MAFVFFLGPVLKKTSTFASEKVLGSCFVGRWVLQTSKFFEKQTATDSSKLEMYSLFLFCGHIEDHLTYR